MIHRKLYLLIVGALLAACTSPVLRTGGQVIVAWHSLTGKHEQALLELVDRWNASNPDGVVVVPERHASAAIHYDIIQGIARDALPGLMLVNPMQAAIYQQRGILTTLNGFIDNPADDVGWGSGDRADLYPFVLKAGHTPNGQIIGIPFGGIVGLMLYNRDWLKTLNLDDAPADWDRFSAACASATDRAKGTLCFGINPNSITFEQWLYSQGGRVTTDDMSVLQVSTPLAFAAMNRLSSYMRANLAYRVSSEQQSRDDFTTSRVLFSFDWSDSLATLGPAIKQRADFDWGVSLLPSVAQKKATKYVAPLWVVTHKASAPRQSQEKAAWLFIRWLEQTPQTAYWAKMTGELPARLSAQNLLGSKQPLDPNQQIVLKAVAPLAQPEPIISGWGCVQNVIDNAMRQVFDGRPVTETMQLAQATGQSELNYDCSAQ